MTLSDYEHRRRELLSEIADADNDAARWQRMIDKAGNDDVGTRTKDLARPYLKAAKDRRTRADVALNALEREHGRRRR